MSKIYEQKVKQGLFCPLPLVGIELEIKSLNDPILFCIQYIRFQYCGNNSIFSNGPYQEQDHK